MEFLVWKVYIDGNLILTNNEFTDFTLISSVKMDPESIICDYCEKYNVNKERVTYTVERKFMVEQRRQSVSK